MLRLEHAPIYIFTSRCGISGRTCYMVFCNLRVHNIDVETRSKICGRNLHSFHMLILGQSDLKGGREMGRLRGEAVSLDHMGKMGLLKEGSAAVGRIPGHKLNLFLLLHLFPSFTSPQRQRIGGTRRARERGRGCDNILWRHTQDLRRNCGVTLCARSPPRSELGIQLNNRVTL